VGVSDVDAFNGRLLCQVMSAELLLTARRRRSGDVSTQSAEACRVITHELIDARVFSQIRRGFPNLPEPLAHRSHEVGETLRPKGDQNDHRKHQHLT
jgi:hypothetical protein